MQEFWNISSSKDIERHWEINPLKKWIQVQNSRRWIFPSVAKTHYSHRHVLYSLSFLHNNLLLTMRTYLTKPSQDRTNLWVTLTLLWTIFLLEVLGRTLILYSMCKPFSCWALITSLGGGVKRTGINIFDTESQLDSQLQQFL